MIVLLYTGAIFVHYVHLAVYAVLTEHSAAFILLFYIRSSDLAVEASAQSCECAQWYCKWWIYMLHISAYFFMRGLGWGMSWQCGQSNVVLRSEFINVTSFVNIPCWRWCKAVNMQSLATYYYHKYKLLWTLDYWTTNIANLKSNHTGTLESSYLDYAAHD